ncbi:MAG: DUF3300 domain-containing protein [Gammaproteobacteria bacterium]|nr:DUF3300 domain-containing protein [Gammaproteobacteria bacterium]
MKSLTFCGTEARTWPALLLILLFSGANAQVPVDEDGNPTGSYRIDSDVESATGTGDDPLSAVELEELVGPIALYPDDLLAIVLPASTYPLEIVQAARFLEALEDDASLTPDADWDDSVVALLNYPDVIRMMDEDIDWTWRLGEAVLGQQAELIAAVETFRDRAYAAGNLKTDDRQKVNNEDGVIEIVPVNEEIIYVPYYEPAEVVVRQPRTVYYYYPDPYPVYYYPYPAGYYFRSGYFWGVTTAFTIGWPNHYLHVYHPSYWGHPYYGRYYHTHHYRRPSITVYNNWYVDGSYRSSTYRHRDGDYWRPRTRAGARQYQPQVVNRHYPPASRDRGREHQVARRESVQRESDGRMELSLRPRSESRANPGVTNTRNVIRTSNVNRTGGTSRRGEPVRTGASARGEDTALPRRLTATNGLSRDVPRSTSSSARSTAPVRVQAESSSRAPVAALRPEGRSGRTAPRVEAPTRRAAAAPVEQRAPAPPRAESRAESRKESRASGRGERATPRGDRRRGSHD